MPEVHGGAQGPALSKLQRFGVPLVVGILVDGASELLKFAAHHQRQDFEYFSLRDVPSALFLWLLAIALVGFSAFLLEKFSDRKPLIRTVLLVLSLTLVGALDPWSVLSKRELLLEACDRIQTGQSLRDVTKDMFTEPMVIAHVDNDQYGSSCTGDCWLRFTYDIPKLWGSEVFQVDFGSNQRVLRTKKF
jgi:hypothetical protein